MPLSCFGALSRPEVLPPALAILKDESRGTALRLCAIVGLVNAGTSAVVPELLAALNDTDLIRNNFVDAIGALADASQLSAVLPLIAGTEAMLSSTYHHFRDLISREALIAVLRYLGDRPHELESLRLEVYVEPILSTIPEFFDDEIINLCAEILYALSVNKNYLDRGGMIGVMLKQIGNADRFGEVARRVYERELCQPTGLSARALLGPITTTETAQWLINVGATPIIGDVGPFVRPEIREFLRPHSAGLIETRERIAQQYAAADKEREQRTAARIRMLQTRLLTRTRLEDALADLSEIPRDYWPEVPGSFKTFLEEQISALLAGLRLENSIQWNGSSLSQPPVLALLIQIISRYTLRLTPDELMVFPALGVDERSAANYYGIFGFSDATKRTIERLLSKPPSSRALENLVRFILYSGFSSAPALATLRSIAADATRDTIVRADAIRILERSNEPDEFFVQLVNDSSAAIAGQAFITLVDRQHRPTIERELASLLADDQKLQQGEVGFPSGTPLDWIGRIKSEFAQEKLGQLRQRSLHLNLERVSTMLTESLAQIDRPWAANLIRKQLSITPPSWRHFYQVRAIEHERNARIEQAQRTPFETVLRKLRGSTSAEQVGHRM